jgi:dTDP-4-dehydrorhamnose reductase
LETLIVGADGKIGSKLVEVYEKNHISVLKTTRNIDSLSNRYYFLDLSEDVENWVLPSLNIDVVFFCAGKTSIDYCENEPLKSREINVVNTIKLIKRFYDLGAFVIYISSNAVFNGETPFSDLNEESDPKTEYGRQKVEVESYLLGMCENVAIARFGKILSVDMPLFNDWIIKLRNAVPINVFSDMNVSPVSLDYAIDILIKISQKKIKGIYHCSAIHDISYSAVAYYISSKLGLDASLINCISYKDLGIKFSPRYTTLNSSKLQEFQSIPPSPFDAINQYLIFNDES